MGQREGLSAKDILKLKTMYKCEISTIKPTLNVNVNLMSGGCSEWANPKQCGLINAFIYLVYYLFFV